MQRNLHRLTKRKVVSSNWTGYAVSGSDAPTPMSFSGVSARRVDHEDAVSQPQGGSGG
jgi:hypothetical protein